MTKRQLATACCRVIAVMFLSDALMNVSAVFYPIPDMLGVYAGILIEMLLATLLWAYSRNVATWIFPEEGDTGIVISAGTQELFAVIIAAYGAIKIINSIPSIVRALPEIIEKSRVDIPTGAVWLRSGLVNLIIGIALIAFARAIAEMLGGRETERSAHK